jgi:hypothetical protein
MIWSTRSTAEGVSGWQLPSSQLVEGLWEDALERVGGKVVAKSVGGSHTSSGQEL